MIKFFQNILKIGNIPSIFLASKRQTTIFQSRTTCSAWSGTCWRCAARPSPAKWWPAIAPIQQLMLIRGVWTDLVANGASTATVRPSFWPTTMRVSCSMKNILLGSFRQHIRFLMFYFRKKILINPPKKYIVIKKCFWQFRTVFVDFFERLNINLQMINNYNIFRGKILFEWILKHSQALPSLYEGVPKTLGPSTWSFWRSERTTRVRGWSRIKGKIENMYTKKI